MALPGYLNDFRRIRPIRGGEFECFPANTPIAVSQTIKKYDFLSLNSSGALQQAIAAPAAAAYTASGGNLPFCGVAMADFTTDSNGVLTTPNQAGIATSGGFGDNTSNYGCPPVAMNGSYEIMLRLFSGTGGTLAGVTLTSTQQDDVVIGYSQYQFVRWYATSNNDTYLYKTGLSYALFTTTTNGELTVVERAVEAVGSAKTDNYGLLWVRPNHSNTVNQV